MLKNTIVFAILASVLTGCASLAPETKKPDIQLPMKFSNALIQGEARLDNALPWWSLFEDSTLVELIKKAQLRNVDIRSAITQVEMARALRGDARQDYFPRGNLGADVHEFRKSTLETGTTTVRGDQQKVGIQTQWEMDLFGRIRSANQAALARLEASEAIVEQVQHVVTADIVRTYFNLRAAQDRLALRLQYQQAQADIVELIQSRVAIGSGKPEDLERALAELKEDESSVVLARADVVGLQHALAVLVHDVPGEFVLSAAGPLQPLELKPLVSSTPTDWFRRRPDVRAVERRLHAEVADIGIVTADLFPQLSIDGYFGYVAGRGDALQGTGNESWSVGPQLRWGVFELGRVKARIQQATIEADAALVEFERTVLQGLAETQTAFSQLSAAQERLAATQTQAFHAEKAAHLINLRYQEGVVSFLELLDAQRSLLRANLARNDSIASHRRATVDVFQAFGIDHMM